MTQAAWTIDEVSEALDVAADAESGEGFGMPDELIAGLAEKYDHMPTDNVLAMVAGICMGVYLERQRVIKEGCK